MRDDAYERILARLIAEYPVCGSAATSTGSEQAKPVARRERMRFAERRRRAPGEKETRDVLSSHNVKCVCHSVERV